MISRERITFRPEAEQDTDFVLRLYASTRQTEMDSVPWSAEEKERFVLQQFEAQRLHYRTYYSDSELLIILLDGRPVGRLYLHRTGNDLLIIDISLMPEVRGQGLGGMLLREIQDRAAAAGEVVSIHVEQFNPALHLYQRLGFVKVKSYGVYDLMEWRSS
jgi:RimJ/RimL family protein N-acetyltransferase